MFLFVVRLFVVCSVLVSSVYAGGLVPAGPPSSGSMYFTGLDGRDIGPEFVVGGPSGESAVDQSPYAMQEKSYAAVVQESDDETSEDEDKLMIYAYSDSDTDSDRDMFDCFFSQTSDFSSQSPTAMSLDLSSDSEQVRVGQKRSKETQDKDKVSSVKKTRQSKYNGVDFKSVAYWQVHPTESGQLQLCDKDGQVLHTESVRTHKGERSLNRGKLQIQRHRKTYHFKRHVDDRLPIEKSGFVSSYDGVFKIYDAEYEASGRTKAPKYDDIDLEAVAYWQINPEKHSEFQLCDKDGQVLHTEAVITRTGKRALIQGWLRIWSDKKKGYRFKRHSADQANLGANGFKESYDGVFKVYGAEYEASGRTKAPKYDDIDLESVAYWQINPDPKHPGQLQLCDKKGKVLQTQSVRTQKGERALGLGKLYIRHNGKTYDFKRHAADKIDLKKSGFRDSYDGVFKIYDVNPVKTVQYNGLAIACWRVHPTRTCFLQLIDVDGHIAHVQEVLIRSRRKRLLRKGFLSLNTEVKMVRFKRHPDDEADLEENGFFPGQKPKVLDRSKAPIIIEEDDGVEDAIIEVSDGESDVEISNTELDEECLVYKLLDEDVEMSDESESDINVPEYNSDSESSDDELMIAEE